VVKALTGGNYSLTGFTVIQVSSDGEPSSLKTIEKDRVLHGAFPRLRYLIN